MRPINDRLSDDFFKNPLSSKMRIDLKRLQAIMMHYGETVIISGQTYYIATKKLCPGVFELLLTSKVAKV